VPSTIQGYRNEVQSCEREGRSCTLESPPHSASKFEDNEYLALRILWTQGKMTDLKERDWAFADRYRDEAKEYFDQLSGWESYLEAIEKFSSLQAMETCVEATVQSFGIVWQLQKQILTDLRLTPGQDQPDISTISPISSRTRLRTQPDPGSPSPRPRATQSSNGINSATDTLVPEEPVLVSDEDTLNELETLEIFEVELFGSPAQPMYFPEIGDEETANMWINAFVIAITATSVAFKTRWLPERKRFIFNHRMTFTAKTDGYLRSNIGDAVHAIIEAKARVRTSLNPKPLIRVQEGAEMAACIFQQKMKAHDFQKECRYVYSCIQLSLKLIDARILLLSIDRHEVWLTFPKFSKEYPVFMDMSLEELREEHFLTMVEYGPFRLNVRSEIQTLGGFLLAYTLSQCNRT